MSMFKSHPLRDDLIAELHARPPLPLVAPAMVSYLAFLHAENSREREAEHLARLGVRLGQTLDARTAHHLVVDGGAFVLKWERHNEFSSYTFSTGRISGGNALEPVSAEWLGEIPGQLIAATHIKVVDAESSDPEHLLEEGQEKGPLTVSSHVGGGAATVQTDFQLHDGFTCFTLIDQSLGPQRTGRTVQRLLEIEIYRVMALLAFPVAKEVGRLLNRAEGDLARLIDRMGVAQSPEDERSVLTDLTHLAGEIEHSVASTTFRFGASAAYYRLVQQRVAELKEARVSGLPTIKGFMQRRLAPALATCETIASRQADLSARIARTSQLLRTRVDLELERQNQELLTQMNRRARLQLRLQETVEGLSVVAITYYASQLVQYVSKGVKPLLPWISSDVVTAVSIPLIAGFVALGLRRMRRELAHEAGETRNTGHQDGSIGRGTR